MGFRADDGVRLLAAAMLPILRGWICVTTASRALFWGTVSNVLTEAEEGGHEQS